MRAAAWQAASAKGTMRCAAIWSILFHRNRKPSFVPHRRHSRTCCQVYQLGRVSPALSCVVELNPRRWSRCLPAQDGLCFSRLEPRVFRRSPDLQSSRSHRRSFLILLALLIGSLSFGYAPVTSASSAAARSAAASYSCDEAGLDRAIVAGGTATLACGSNATITITGPKRIGRDLSLDGANRLTLSGGN